MARTKQTNKAALQKNGDGPAATQSIGKSPRKTQLQHVPAAARAMVGGKNPRGLAHARAAAAAGAPQSRAAAAAASGKKKSVAAGKSPAHVVPPADDENADQLLLDVNPPPAGVAAAPRAAKEKKKRRKRPGELAIKEIRKYQNSGDLVMRKRPFMRLVREITANQLEGSGLELADARFQPSSILALQEASEVFLVLVMELAQDSAIHAGRSTIMRVDIQHACRIAARAGAHAFDDLKSADGRVSFEEIDRDKKKAAQRTKAAKAALAAKKAAALAIKGAAAAAAAAAAPEEPAEDAAGDEDYMAVEHEEAIPDD